MKNPLPPLSELLPRDLLSRLQADCATLLGGTTTTFGADGAALTDLFTVSPYCRQVVATPGGQSRCAQSRRDLATEAIQTGKTQQAQCHAGVTLLAVPFLMAGEAVAATVVSLYSYPRDRDSALLTARALEIDPALLIGAADRSPPLSPDRLRAAVRLLEDLHRLYGLHLTAAHETDQVRRQVAQSARRMKALYNSSRAITSTLSLDQMVRVFVEQMAILAGLDRCLLSMVDATDLRLRPAAAYGLTPHESQRFHALDPVDLAIRPEWWDRLAQGRAVHLPLGWIRSTEIGSFLVAPEDRRAMLLPVVNHGHLWAVAYLHGSRDADSLTQQEIDLAMAIAGQAGIAIANISKLEQEQRVARTLQKSLLSPIAESHGPFSIGSLYMPALAEAQVGGDFFDLIDLGPDRFALLLGDVSGKGVGAAVHTGMIKYMARALAIDDPAPASLISRLNRAVAKQGGLDSGFVTLCYALVESETGRFLAGSAGHEPPLLYHTHLNEAREFVPSGPAIGLLDEFSYPQEERLLDPGDSLLFYTDGAVEARNENGDFFGLDQLRDLFTRSARKSGPEIVSAIHTGLQRFTNGGLQDDLALVVLKRSATP